MSDNYNVSENVNEFVAGLGNGKRSLAALGVAVMNVSLSNDGTVFARMIERCNKRGDHEAGRRVGMVVNKLWEGAKVSCKEGAVSVKLRGSVVNAAKLAAFEEVCARRVSLRSDAVRVALADAKKAETKEAKLLRALEAFKKAGGDMQEAMLLAESVWEG